MHEILYDEQGEIYGWPCNIEYDITIQDHEIIMVEITSFIKRSDLVIIKKKKEFYEKEKNVKITKVMVITPFIYDKNPDRIKASAISILFSRSS